MDYVSFKQSIDDYTNAMFNEYLAGIPPEIQADKELLIRWSKQFHLTRGSHESYKFLFKVLFNDDDVNIYLPKDNILRTSDGTWIDNQSIMIVTNPGNPDVLMYKRIKQTIELGEGLTREASATVEGYINLNYSGRFDTVHLILVDIEGEFDHLHPVYTDDENPISVWPVLTVVDFEIENGGQNYFSNELIDFADKSKVYVHEGDVVIHGSFDTRITTLFTVNEIELFVDGVQVLDFDYDGQFVHSAELELGKSVRFEIPNVNYGTLKIGKTSANGSVTRLLVENPPIGFNNQTEELVYVTGPDTTSVGLGTGLVATAKLGVVRKLPGYYADTRGWLSSTMYLQDGEYYQDFSYEIQSVHEVLKYANVVKNILHPSGFKMFGRTRIYSLIEMFIGTLDEFSGVFIGTLNFYNLALYSAGNNYTWYAKAGFMSDEVYKDHSYFDPVYVYGDTDYVLQDISLERAFDIEGNPIVIGKRGWMAKFALADGDVILPQDYITEENAGWEGLYFEGGYITGSFDETLFINTYINTYSATNYVDSDYWD